MKLPPTTSLEVPDRYVGMLVAIYVASALFFLALGAYEWQRLGEGIDSSAEERGRVIFILIFMFGGFIFTSALLHLFVGRVRRHYQESMKALIQAQEATIEARTRELEERNGDLQQEIAEWQRREHELRYTANHDALTDIPNRLLFNDRLQAAFNQARRHHRIFALLQVDLDRFKEVNDSLGHAAGDQLLVEAARRLCSCVRESDTVARMGGDEFSIILTEMRADNEAEVIARRTVAILSEPFYLDAGTANISGCVGIALYPQHAQDSEQLQRNADVALYAAKAGGRNTYRIYSPILRGDKLQGDLL